MVPLGTRNSETIELKIHNLDKNESDSIENQQEFKTLYQSIKNIDELENEVSNPYRINEPESKTPHFEKKPTFNQNLSDIDEQSVSVMNFLSNFINDLFTN